MQNFSKKFLAILLTLCMLASYVPFGVFAAEASAEVVNQQLMLGDDLTMHFYTKVENAANATATITVGGVKRAAYSLADMTAGDDGYDLSVDLAPAEMTEQLVLTVNDGASDILTKEYSVQSYAHYLLENNYTDETKALVKEMLNYGAKAQLHFNHNTGSLATAALTADQLALPAAYNSGMVSSVPSAPANKQGIFANNQGFAKRTPSISFEGAFCINYFFTPKYAPDSGITMYYWTAEDYNAASVLTTSNATGKIKLEGSGTGQYQGDIEGIAAKALSEAVYVACAYRSGGTVWTSGVLGYSIGAYCSGQSTKAGTIADLA